VKYFRAVVNAKYFYYDKSKNKKSPAACDCTVYVPLQLGSPDTLTNAPLTAVTMSLFVCPSSNSRASSERDCMRDLVTSLDRVRLPVCVCE
jgi:hypothetical protein